MVTFKELLNRLDACYYAKEWAADKTWQEVYETCERGDWLLWLHFRTANENLQERTLAKGLIANTVRHLMKDERSIKAVDAAIAFGKGEITRDQLNAAAAADAAAYAAAATAYATAAAAADAAAAAAAADAAAAAAYATAAAAADAAAYAAAAYAAAAALKASLKNSADIIRSVIPMENFNIA